LGASAADGRASRKATEKKNSLAPLAAREVQAQLKRTRKDSRAAVLVRFDAEERGLMADTGVVEDALLKDFSTPPPVPSALDLSFGPAYTSPTEAVSGAASATIGGNSGSTDRPQGCHRRPLGGVSMKLAVELWAFLRTFAKPLGLRATPTLEQLGLAVARLSPREMMAGSDAHVNHPGLG
ncbi:unnamed protein product, partial [Discosporangium mesarthrocarpum]